MSPKKNPHESIARGTLIKQAKVWFYFLYSVILPSKHLYTVREKKAVLLYAILKGYKFNVGKIIENSILSYYRGGYKVLIPHPTLITRLYILGGVEGDWEEEENCPRNSPMTLTGITKGPKNRGKEREAKVARGKEENIEINQIQLESEALEQQHRQRSVSPILTLSLDVRQAHQKQARSLEHQNNNVELIDMLETMRQEMQEMNKQMQIQLQLRDEYMDAELRRRDQNLEDALKKRDEEWKSRWETRERELSEELRAREDAFISDHLRRDSELIKIMKEREDAMEKNLMHKADAFVYLYKEHQKEIRLLIEKMDKEMEGTLNYRETC